MESFLNRYRNITVLLLVVFAQLILLAVQVKNERDIPMIRTWTVTAVTPAARIIEGIRSSGAAFVRNYITLRKADEENRRLQEELDRLKLENIFLKNELNTADRAKALQVFQAQTQSKTLAVTRVGIGAGANSKVVFVDRGSAKGVQRGMGVITPDGIVGKVIAVYPMASEVMLVTDPDFAAGVVSQKSQSRGTVKGQGTPLCKVDYVPLGEKIEAGEWLYTSGDDRIFPRGIPVGIVKSVRDAQPYKEVYMEPAGLRRGIEDMLIIMDGVHQAVPDEPPANQSVFIAPPPPAADPNAAPAQQPAPASGGTDADKLRSQYKAVGESQGVTFGGGPKIADFKKLGAAPAPAAATPGRGTAVTQAAPAATPGASGRGNPQAPAKTESAGRGSPQAAPPANAPSKPGGPPPR